MFIPQAFTVICYEIKEAEICLLHLACYIQCKMRILESRLIVINRSDCVKSLEMIKGGIKHEDRSLTDLAAVYHLQRGENGFFNISPTQFKLKHCFRNDL